MKIFVGSSSRDSMPDEYTEDCKELLEKILKKNDLVFGACSKGLMGLSYRIAKKNHRHVTGICPEVYKSSLDSLECDKEEITTSIIDSTNKIYKNSDVIIMLPGGFGTIYEFFTANYCKICNELDKPIILYNSCGYYDELIFFINKAIQKGIISGKEIDKYYVANNVEEAINYLDKFNNKK